MNRATILIASATMAMSLTGCAASDDPVKARNVSSVRVVFSEIWSKGNVDLIDDLYEENFVGHFPGETLHGREGIQSQVVAHRRAFPDWTEEIEDTIAERDRVVVRLCLRAIYLTTSL